MLKLAAKIRATKRLAAIPSRVLREVLCQHAAWCYAMCSVVSCGVVRCYEKCSAMLRTFRLATNLGLAANF